MLSILEPGTVVSTISPTCPPKTEPIRHLLSGSIAAVQSTIKILHKLGYPEPNDWSKPLPTGRPGEVTAILKRKVVVG